jgi:hypothetical protein
MAWTASDIEERLADGEPGTPPGTQGTRAPNNMLKAEARDFVVARTQDVVAIGSYRCHRLSPPVRTLSRIVIVGPNSMALS